MVFLILLVIPQRVVDHNLEWIHNSFLEEESVRRDKRSPGLRVAHRLHTLCSLFLRPSAYKTCHRGVLTVNEMTNSNPLPFSLAGLPGCSLIKQYTSIPSLTATRYKVILSSFDSSWADPSEKHCQPGNAFLEEKNNIMRLQAVYLVNL